MSAFHLLFLGCTLLVNNVAGFYLPGAAPHDYKLGEKVDLFVNALTPMLANEEHAKLVRLQLLRPFNDADVSQKSLINCLYLQSIMPPGYSPPRLIDDYYNPAFHFCQPEGGPKAQPERLGSILFGDRIFNSPFDVRLLLSAAKPSLPFLSLTVYKDQNA